MYLVRRGLFQKTLVLRDLGCLGCAKDVGARALLLASFCEDVPRFAESGRWGGVLRGW